MSAPLKVEVLASPPGEVTLRLAGDIDVRADAALGDAYALAATTQPDRLALDFRAVGYINSTGIALIVRLLAEARRDHREVIAVGLSDHYQEIFRLTRLSDYLTIVEPAPSVANPEGAQS